MDALQVLKERRSVRKYLNTPVPKEIIEDIVDCGRLAASGCNVQPWHFVVVTDPKSRQDIAGFTEHGRFIADAPVCVIVLCEDTKYMLEDGSAATQNILLAAKAHGLGSCWVAGHKKEYAKDIASYVGAPEGVLLVASIAIGYTEAKPEPKKKSFNEVLHWERF